MKLFEQPSSAKPVGRFAPSPTGPLHAGSLLAALASYLEARSGSWLVRIEDVDRPRTVAGVSATQLETLAAYGFSWSTSAVVYQSQRANLYESALHRLIEANMAYPCTCSRSMLASQTDARTGVDGALVYPGNCHDWQAGDPVPSNAAWRFRVGDPGDVPVVFHDRIQGIQEQQLARDVGDFVIKRADGCFTYQLAVVVDDISQGVTQIVRGADLLDSTARQIALIRALGGLLPTYAHIPVLTNAAGEKLSKQTLATPLAIATENERVSALWQALVFLGQQPPHELSANNQSRLWAWATRHWDIGKVPKLRHLLV
jgi:glutamyl-Q tRNA(Asp) synthetase